MKLTCPIHKRGTLQTGGALSGKMFASCGCIVTWEGDKVGWVTPPSRLGLGTGKVPVTPKPESHVEGAAINVGQNYELGDDVKNDHVNHPHHYQDGPACEHCGKPVECIVITRRHNFNIGNAIKYLWRAGKKDPAKHIEDLQKAAWYINDEIKRLQAEQGVEHEDR
jgi:hypothetical protein